MSMQSSVVEHQSHDLQVPRIKLGTCKVKVVMVFDPPLCRCPRGLRGWF